MPRVSVGFEILVVQNNHERNKPTNTGRLIPEMIKGSEIIYYAVRGEDFEPRALRDSEVDYVLLFPREDKGVPAPELSAESLAPTSDGRRRGIVILDGTWGQCSRMSRRIPEVAALPAYTLPPGPPGHWGGIRESSDPRRLCTLEATIRVVETCAGREASCALQQHFDKIVAGMMFMKAKSPTPEVPEAWRKAWKP